MQIIDIIGLIITIVIQGIIIKYILENEQEKCDCALTWHHSFIKIYAPIVIIMSIIITFFKNSYFNINNIVLSRIINSILLIYMISGIVYCISLVIYFLKLQKESSCECSKDWKRNILMYPVVAMAIIYILTFILGIYLINKKTNIIK